MPGELNESQIRKAAIQLGLPADFIRKDYFVTKAIRLLTGVQSDYFELVFQGGTIYEPKKAVNRVVELSGVPFTLHDLRRTFATVADSLDLPSYALKRLLNHKMNNDVTAGYIMKDVERLRRPMQQVANFLLENMMETAEL